MLQFCQHLFIHLYIYACIYTLTINNTDIKDSTKKNSIITTRILNIIVARNEDYNREMMRYIYIMTNRLVIEYSIT